jgi:DNA-binding NarL/FixJ family response regulator
MGGVAALLDGGARDPKAILRSVVLSGADPRLVATMREAFELGSQTERDKSVKSPRTVTCLSDFCGVSPARHPTYAALVREIGFADVVAIRAFNPDGSGLFLAAVLPRKLDRRSVWSRRWSRVAVHLAAGVRLLRASQHRARSEGEAVLAGDGKVLHATTAAQGAREALRQAALRQDRARGRLRRRDPEAALDAWQALVDGRWSLVDRFESDGKRFVIAVPNPPEATDPRALSESERPLLHYVAMGYSNKLIAYTLGLPEGTISARLAHIKRKLAVRSRQELVQVWASRDRQEHLALHVGSERLHLLSEREPTPSCAEAWARLTRAEREVAELVVAGESNQGIASKRRCSRRTVENLLANVFRKLGLTSRAELAAYAASAGERQPE